MVKPIIIAFLERERADAGRELSKLCDRQDTLNAERARHKRAQRLQRGARGRHQKTVKPVTIMAIPNRAAAFRAAARQFASGHLLAKRDLLELADIDDIISHIWRNKPQLETKLRDRTFETHLGEYLKHLAVRLLREREPPPLPVQSWSEAEVRAVLTLRVKLSKKGSQRLDGLRRHNEMAALMCLRDKANTILAQRFAQSNHLSSLLEFERVAQIYRTDAPLLEDADRETGIAIWQRSVDELVTEMKRRFARAC